MALALLSSTAQAGTDDDSDDRIWISEHSYYRESLAPGEVPEDYWYKGVRYTYDGQQEFHAWGPDCERLHGGAEWASRDGVWVADWPEAGELETIEDTFWSTVTVDAAGSRWVVADLDVEAIQAAADDKVDRIREELGIELPERDVLADLAREAPSQELGDHVDFAWDTESCTGDSAPEISVWAGEDRTQVTNAFESYAAQGYANIYVNDGGWSVVCSGAFIDTNSVVTAAHCLWDGGAIDTEDVWVCTLGNYGFADQDADGIEDSSEPDPQCFPLVNIHRPSDFFGTYSFATDYAVLNLDRTSTTYTNQPYYFLDEHTDASGFLDVGLEVRKYGNPGWVDTNNAGSLCNTISTITGFDQVDAGNVNTRPVFWDEGDIDYLTGSIIGTQIDSSSGDSGAGIYKWEGGYPYHVGVIKGWDSISTFNGGPRTRNFASWVDSHS